MVCFIEGLETFKYLQVDEAGVVYIYYTVTEDYMKDKNLIYKNRIFEVDLTDKEHPLFLSYASSENFVDLVELR